MYNTFITVIFSFLQSIQGVFFLICDFAHQTTRSGGISKMACEVLQIGLRHNW